MSRIQIIDLEYQKHHVPTLILPERALAWPVRHIGRALGYKRDGRDLRSKLRGDWALQLVQHQDLRLLIGDELDMVKKAQDPERPVVARSASRLLVLMGSGLRKVLGLASPLQSVVFEDFMSRNLAGVEPSFASSLETCSPLSEALDKLERLGQRLRAKGTAEKAARIASEQRTAEARVDLEDRQLRVEAIHRVIDVLGGQGGLDPEVHLALEVEACAVATKDRVLLLGSQDAVAFPHALFDPPQIGSAVEGLQLDAMLREQACPLVLAWEPDGRLGAFRYFPGLRDSVLELANPERPDAA